MMSSPEKKSSSRCESFPARSAKGGLAMTELRFQIKSVIVYCEILSVFFTFKLVVKILF